MASIFIIAATGCGSQNNSDDEESQSASAAPVTTGVPAQISITDGSSSLALINDGTGHLATQMTYPDGTIDTRQVPSSGGGATVDQTQMLLTVTDPDLGTSTLNVLGGTYDEVNDVFQVQLQGNGVTNTVTLAGFGMQADYQQLMAASASTFGNLGPAGLHSMAAAPPPAVVVGLLAKIIAICTATWIAFAACVAIALAAAIAYWYTSCRGDVNTGNQICLASGGIPGAPVIGLICSVPCLPKCPPAGGAKITADTCTVPDAGTSDGGSTDSGTTDSGTTDAGRTDSGTIDSGIQDAAPVDARVGD